MNRSDGERAFKEDVRTRASAARSSHNKKGSTRKCRLSQDYMTKAQLAAKNGEVITMRLNSLYSWEEFKSFPYDFQVEYINNLILKYGVSMNIISQAVFGLSRSTLAGHIANIGRSKNIRQAYVTNGGGSAALAAAVERGRSGDPAPFASPGVTAIPPSKPATVKAVDAEPKLEPVADILPEEPRAQEKPPKALVFDDPTDTKKTAANAKPKKAAEKKSKEEKKMPVEQPKEPITAAKGRSNYVKIDMEAENVGMFAGLLQEFAGKRGRVKIFIEVDD